MVNCNFKVNKELGFGRFGVVFVFRKRCVLKIERIESDNKNEKEWNCLNILYKSLYKVIPDHIIKPIKLFYCSGDQLNKNILDSVISADLQNSRSGSVSSTISSNSSELSFKLADYRIQIFNKLGDFTLDYLFSQKYTDIQIKEILFQLMIYLLYMKKYTNISHLDIHGNNIVLKKNTKIIPYIYNFENKRCLFTMTPQYLAYFIDFGFCNISEKLGTKNDEGFYIYYNTDDIIKLWCVFLDYKYSFSREFCKFLENYNPLGDIKKLEKLLTHKIFADVVERRIY
jgi:hypothetical protein